MTAGFFFRILQTMCDEVDEIKVLDFSYFFGNVNVLLENLDSLSETILILLFFFAGLDNVLHATKIVETKTQSNVQLFY